VPRTLHYRLSGIYGKAFRWGPHPSGDVLKKKKKKYTELLTADTQRFDEFQKEEYLNAVKRIGEMLFGKRWHATFF
jgi:hypothetical protein